MLEGSNEEGVVLRWGDLIMTSTSLSVAIWEWDFVDHSINATSCGRNFSSMGIWNLEMTNLCLGRPVTVIALRSTLVTSALDEFKTMYSNYISTISKELPFISEKVRSCNDASAPTIMPSATTSSME
jgi:hypothetical protein